MLYRWTVVLLTMAAAWGQTPSVSRADLKLQATTDGKTAVTIVTQLEVGSTEEIKGLVLDSDGLTGPGGIQVDGSNLKFVATGVDLAKGGRVPVAISIGGLTKAGTYSGSFVLRAPGAKDGAAVTVSIGLAGKPVVTLGSDGLTSFTCLVAWSCRLAELWIPARRTISADNSKGVGNANVTGKWIVLRATRGDRVLTESELKPEIDPNPVERYGTIRLSVPNGLRADRYQGSIRLDVENADDPVTANVALDIRHAPWIALLVLGVGILLGRFVQSLNTPLAQLQQRLLGSLFALQGAESDVHDAAVASLLGALFERLRQDINLGVKSETELTQELSNLSTAIDLAKDLERIRAQAQGIDPTAGAEVAKHLDAARKALFKEDFVTADSERLAAQQALLGATAPATAAAAPASAMTPRFHFLTPAPEPKRPLHLQLLQGFAGTKPMPPEARFAYAKPILFGLLFIGLLVLGLYTLYVKNTTFGADVVFDYFSLIAWGLSADVAQRTLQNLQLPK